MREKKKRGIEVIIAPEKEGEIKNVYISPPVLIIILVGFILFVSGVGYLIYCYTHSLVDARLVTYLEEVKEKKERKIEIMEKTIPELESKLSEIRLAQDDVERKLQLDKLRGDEGNLKRYEKMSIGEALLSARTLRQRLETIYSRVKNMGDDSRRIPSLKPTKGWIYRKFGYYESPFTNTIQMHRGIDIVGKRGQPIVASADGVVIFSGLKGGYGLTVEIDHGNGYITAYCHNKGNVVEVGDVVKRGQLIAYMGNTGRSTGTHLHYEVRYNGKYIDPEPFLLIEEF